jgi:hypothetical protein
MTDLKFYGDILHKMNYEGVGYYLASYETEEKFEPDPELKQVFLDARNALNRFIELVHERVEDAGGDPDDYES